MTAENRVRETRSNIKVDWEGPAEPGLISIVTVVRNDRDGLRRTLESLDQQTYRVFEHVVVDGASTDGSLELLRTRKSDQMTWQSEPDSGIADAFNKGLARARGAWIQFLNAGDTFLDEEGLGAMAILLNAPAIVSAFARMGEKTIPKRPPESGDPLRRRALISHQASFTPRQVFEECGGFDRELSVRMDYEFWLRALSRYPLIFVDRILIEYRGGGNSAREMAGFHREERIANLRHLEHPAGPNLRAWLRPLWLKVSGG